MFTGRRSFDPRRGPGLCAGLALAAALVGGPARVAAHSTTFAMYSKYEATAAGDQVAFVFALDRLAVLRLLEHDAAHAPVEGSRPSTSPSAQGRLEGSRPSTSPSAQGRLEGSRPSTSPSAQGRLEGSRPSTSPSAQGRLEGSRPSTSPSAQGRLEGSRPPTSPSAQGRLDPAAIDGYQAFFSRYLFDRFSVKNNGVLCRHPEALDRFFWDRATNRVLAVTKFVCAAPLAELTIRSLVTHDMPTSHELVGDLQYGHALTRSFFSGDDVEAHIVLAALPQSGAAERTPRTRGKFSYVAMPDRERRYQALASAELGFDPGAAADVRPLATLVHFVGQGVLHIFTGYDHVLFILTLMLAVTSWRRLAVIVTSFTAAHSLTLIVATLGLVTLPAAVVEPLIALSVLLVAADALLRPRANARPLVTFGFGLLHGFGLSNVLRGLGLSGRELAPALLGFNVGVEVGQLLIVAPLFPLVLWLRRQGRLYGRARTFMCGSVALAALCWIVVRVNEAIHG